MLDLELLVNETEEYEIYRTDSEENCLKTDTIVTYYT